MDIKIRNIDEAAIAKIDQFLRDKNKNQKKKISRESYLREYINTLAVLPELEDNHNKYAGLIEGMAKVIDNNTELLGKVSDFIDNKK